MRTGLRKLIATTGAFVVLAAGMTLAAAPAMAQEGAKPPVYKYDPLWPKPLPNKWIFGSISGLTVDSHGNIWMLQRSAGGDADNYGADQNPPVSDCCKRMPSVVAFNPAGDVIASWGGKDYVKGWPLTEHTILVDSKDHVWIGGNAAGDVFLEFTKDGKFIREFGERGPLFEGLANKMNMDNQQTEKFLRGTSSAFIDEKNDELFVADGYLNKRVMVYGLTDEKFKRAWGAYGKAMKDIDDVRPPARKPNEPPRKDFTPAVHCVVQSFEGLVYACDRNGNRIQVFKKDGTFVREYIVKPEVLGNGSAAGLALSRDPKQAWMFIGDMTSATLWIMNRETGKIVGQIGRRGLQGGDFSAPHVMSIDAKGNLYVGETAGRLQKYALTK